MPENHADFRGDLLRFLAQQSVCRDAIVWCVNLPADVTPEQAWADCSKGDWLLFMVYQRVADFRLRYRVARVVAELTRPVWPSGDDPALQKANDAIGAINALTTFPDLPEVSDESYETRLILRARAKKIAGDASMQACQAFLESGDPARASAGYAIFCAGWDTVNGILSLAQQSSKALAYAAVPDERGRPLQDMSNCSAAWQSAYDTALAQCADAVRTVIRAEDVWPIQGK